MPSRHRQIYLLALALVGLLASCTPQAPQSTVAPAIGSTAGAAMTGHLPAFTHIFVIVLENKPFDTAIGTDQTSYLSMLAQQYGWRLTTTGSPIRACRTTWP